MLVPSDLPVVPEDWLHAFGKVSEPREGPSLTPSLCQASMTTLFIKFNLNYPNLNAPSVSYCDPNLYNRKWIYKHRKKDRKIISG